MPEGLEAEIYRRAVAGCVGRTVASIDVDPRQADAEALRALLPGRRVASAGRHGKLVLVGLDGPDGLDIRGGCSGPGDGLTLGLHFGMTGRVVVDGAAPIDALEYGSGRDDPAWDRLVVRFDEGGQLRVNDPRRWATFTLDPDVASLGPDVLALTAADLTAALHGRRAPLKALLLDQRAVAGFGNLCVDEVLWHAGIAPARPADRVSGDDVRRLAAVTRRRLPAMLRRGGSHCGTISPAVRAGLPACPRDGAPLRRDTVGGRTTVWCPAHQR